jgi:hypothetical protein
MGVLQYVIGACCAAAALCGPAAAQEAAPEGRPAEQAQPAAEPGETPVAVPGRHVHRRASASSIDSRVKLLTTELKLTPQQQQSVRKILEDQRQQVARTWSDATVPSAVRVKTTQSIGDHTADQIRALLTDEQRSRYIKPRQPGTGATKADAEQWMNSARGSSQEARP